MCFSTLTNAGVSGAKIAPILPIIEEKAKRLFLYLVGYSSVVYTYTDVITLAILNLPIKYNARETPSSPETLKIILKFQYHHLSALIISTGVGAIYHLLPLAL